MRCRFWVLTFALAGCAVQPPKPPQVVKVPVTVIVPVPAELTKPVPIAAPTSLTVGEAVRVARERKAALEQCNSQLDAIRTLPTGDKP